MARFEVVVPAHGCPAIDLDVHAIPARPGEPAHEHHDLRFLLVAGPGQRLAMSDESTDLRWFEWSELGALAADESVLRLARKARAALAAATRDRAAPAPPGGAVSG